VISLVNQFRFANRIATRETKRLGVLRLIFVIRRSIALNFAESRIYAFLTVARTSSVKRTFRGYNNNDDNNVYLKSQLSHRSRGVRDPFEAVKRSSSPRFRQQPGHESAFGFHYGRRSRATPQSPRQQTDGRDPRTFRHCPHGRRHFRPIIYSRRAPRHVWPLLFTNNNNARDVLRKARFDWSDGMFTAFVVGPHSSVVFRDNANHRVCVRSTGRRFQGIVRSVRLDVQLVRAVRAPSVREKIVR